MLLSSSALATVFKTIVRTVREYTSLCWMEAAEPHLRKLDAVQNAAFARLGPAAAELPNLNSLAHRRMVGALAYLFKLQSWTPPGAPCRAGPAAASASSRPHARVAARARSVALSAVLERLTNARAGVFVALVPALRR